jgi:hypothetical protein
VTPNRRNFSFAVITTLFAGVLMLSAESVASPRVGVPSKRVSGTGLTHHDSVSDSTTLPLLGSSFAPPAQAESSSQSTGQTRDNSLDPPAPQEPKVEAGQAVPSAAVAGATCTPQPGLPTNAPVLTPGVWRDVSPAGPPFGSSTFTFTQGIAIDPCNRAVIYVAVQGFDYTAARAGLYKTVDAGTTWSRISDLDEPLRIRIDPADPQHLVVADGVRGGTLGLWVSRDGGNTFSTTPGWAAQRTDKFIDDLYDVAVDPADFNHMLVTSHSAWGWDDQWNQNSGVLETLDAGVTWITHRPIEGWGTGHNIWFLNNSSTWLIGTQAAGYWRTTDAGATWQQVTTDSMVHGGGQLYKSPTGALYVTSWAGVLRNADGTGRSWVRIGGGTGNGLIGDGSRLYSGPYFANGSDNMYRSAPETNPSQWTTFNQTVTMGPFEMAHDAVNGIIYSASWDMGVLALKVSSGTRAPTAPTNLRIVSQQPPH